MFVMNRKDLHEENKNKTWKLRKEETVMYIDYGQAPVLLRRVACPRTTAHALQLFDPTSADHWLLTALRPDTFLLGSLLSELHFDYCLETKSFWP
jgi:hypothetical protein